jgi:hypothetical protein
MWSKTASSVFINLCTAFRTHLRSKEPIASDCTEQTGQAQIMDAFHLTMSITFSWLHFSFRELKLGRGRGQRGGRDVSCMVLEASRAPARWTARSRSKNTRSTIGNHEPQSILPKKEKNGLDNRQNNSTDNANQQKPEVHNVQAVKVSCNK